MFCALESKYHTHQGPAVILCMLILAEISARCGFLEVLEFICVTYIFPSVLQISIKEIKEEEGHVVVRCIISAASSNHFSSSSAKVPFLTLQIVLL